MNGVMKAISSWLNRPFPKLESVGEIVFKATFISTIVFLVLFILRPFEITSHLKNPTLTFLTYAVMTFLSVILIDFTLPLLFKKFFNPQKWSIGKHLTEMLASIGFVSIMNWYLHNSMEIINDSQTFFGMIIHTYSVAIIPGVFITWVIEKRLYRKMYHNAKFVTEKLQRKKPTICPDVHLSTFDEDIQLNCAEFIYSSVEGNYVQLYRHNSALAVLNHTVRLTLQELLKKFNCCNVIAQPHRSYLINLNKVSEVSGNARGYTLHIDSMNLKIPVARNRSKEILHLLSNAK